MKKWIKRIFPFLAWRSRFDRRGMARDTLAAVLAALVLIPQGMACALVAGLPPEYGLYAALVPVIVTALWGSSWHLASGPGVAMALLLFTVVTPLTAVVSSAASSGFGFGGFGGFAGGATTTVIAATPVATPEYIRMVLLLTVLVGAMQVVIGGLRRGALVNFVSQAVLLGFSAGVALLVTISALRNALGLSIDRNWSAWRALSNFFRNFFEINNFMLAVALLTLVVVVSMRRWLPRGPALAAALLLGSLFAYGVNQFYGLDRTGVRMLDVMSFTWPPFARPEMSWKAFGQLAPAALALALLALAQAVSNARRLASTSGQRIDVDRETIGQGLGNFVGGMFSGFVTTASPERSRANLALGARTPLAAILSAVLVFAIVYFAARYANRVPLAVLAALTLVLAWDLLDVKGIIATWRTDRQEMAALAITFFATQMVDLVDAIYIGLLLSLLLQAQRGVRVRLTEVKPVAQLQPPQFIAHSATADCPQLKMMRLDGALTAASVDVWRDAFERVATEAPLQRHLLLVASALDTLDAEGATCLASVATRRKEAGGGLYLFDVSAATMRVLRSSGAEETIGADKLFAMGSDPVAAIFKELKPGLCVPCQARIFEVCPKPVEITWRRPPGDKTKGRYTVPPSSWARPVSEPTG